MNAAANDDARYHDFFSAMVRFNRLMEMPLQQVAWLAEQVGAERGGIERMEVGALLDLISEAERRPVLVAGGER